MYGVIGVGSIETLSVVGFVFLNFSICIMQIIMITLEETMTKNSFKNSVLTFIVISISEVTLDILKNIYTIILLA